MTIQPIGFEQQQAVRSVTESYIIRASKLFKIRLDNIPVEFDLKGRASGMYRIRNSIPVIRYNPYLFAKYFEDNLVTTVPHEVAHYVTDRLYGLNNIRPHGAEWRSVMIALGAKPEVTGNYDLTGIPTRRQKRYDYHCQCSTHQLSTQRHNRIQKGKTRYLCRYCGTQLRQTENTSQIKRHWPISAIR